MPYLAPFGLLLGTQLAHFDPQLAHVGPIGANLGSPEPSPPPTRRGIPAHGDEEW